MLTNAFNVVNLTCCCVTEKERMKNYSSKSALVCSILNFLAGLCRKMLHLVSGKQIMCTARIKLAYFPTEEK